MSLRSITIIFHLTSALNLCTCSQVPPMQQPMVGVGSLQPPVFPGPMAMPPPSFPPGVPPPPFIRPGFNPMQMPPGSAPCSCHHTFSHWLLSNRFQSHITSLIFCMQLLDFAHILIKNCKKSYRNTRMTHIFNIKLLTRLYACVL